MNYALIGFGKIGKELLNILGEKNLLFIVDPNLNNYKNIKVYKDIKKLKSVKNLDIIFDFSSYINLIDNFTYLFNNFSNLRIISGTTNYDPSVLKPLILKSSSLFLHANNFSIMMQLLYKIYDLIAKHKKTYFSYAMLEKHHKNKLDKPSGTAKNLAKILNMKDLEIQAIRSGSYPGTHSLYIDSNYETIELSHTVRDRAVFCEGCISASAFLLKQKKPGIYSLADVFKE